MSLAEPIMLCFSRRDQAASMCVLHDAKQVLDQWNVSYFKMRAEIEESGSNSRWEFDLGRLFERTDYMASICEDLFNVLQVCFSKTIVSKISLQLGEKKEQK